MATISTSQTFDSAARTAGEAFTIQNGAVLTIDTHTRYCANAAASAAGSLGSFTMTAATGGECFIDGSKVKMVAYSTGTGNVPAYNTSITQGGVTGTLLGVTSALSAAPTAVGAAMPATGYIMFKTVASGPFVAGALTGIGATVVGSQRNGFLEIVMDDAAGFTIGRAQKFRTRGQWFQPFDTSGNLVTTSGARGQQIQFPNFGGANFFIPWVEIETGVGTGVYEIWPASLAGTGSPWATANLGTDARSRFVQCLGGGIIRIGSDGTNNIGDLPVSGCNVRIPNILLKSAATASRASDSVPSATLATRPDFTTTNAGQIDIEYVTGHWQFNFGQAYSMTMKYSGFFDQMTVTESATAIVMDKVANGNYTIAGDVPALVLTSNFAGFTATDCKFGRSGTIATSDYGVNVSLNKNMTWTRCHFQGRTLRTNASAYPANFSQCNGITMTDCVIVGSGIQFPTSFNITCTNTKYADGYVGISSVTNAPAGALMFTSYASNIEVNGFAWYTSVANVHPDTCIVYLSATLNVKVRNIGTRVAPLDGGSSNAILYLLNDVGNSDSIKIQRCYMNNIGTRLVLNVNSTKGVILENCAGDYADADAQAALNVVVKNVGCASRPTSGASIYGTIWYHIFTSVTAGRLGLAFNEPTAEYASFVTTSFTTSATGTSGFNSNGGLALINNGDSCIFEFPYTIIGIDSFQNVAPTITTATNMLIEYQINTGSGFSAWKTFNATNLSGETVDEVAGFKIKIRATATATNAANILTVVFALTNSNATAQDVLYPLDVNTLTFTGLQANSDVVIYDAGTTTVLGSVDANPTSSWGYVYSGADTIDVGVFKAGYIPVFIRNLAIGTTNSSLPIAQVIDRAYID
jgi:hypothetical protein